MCSNASSDLDLEVLNQHIDEDEGVYRLRAGRRVYYLYISTAVFDEHTMCRPYLLMPRLPRLPPTEWNTMRVSRGLKESLDIALSFDPLPSIQDFWLPTMVDVLSLKRTTSYRSAVHEVIYNGHKAISKVACFEWDIQRLNNETRAYEVIQRYQQQHPCAPRIAPTFLAHLTENGRVIGMLLEKVEGDAASIEDLPLCREALHQLHGMGLVHGDANRYNFRVERSKRRVCLLDFEFAEACDEHLASLEMESLSSELTEESERGNALVIHL